MPHFEADLVSGNSFIAGDGKRAALNTGFGAGLVDMNSSGISESCSALKRPYYLLRIVSDHANESAQADFNSFCSNSAHMQEFWSLFLEAFDAAFQEVPK